ncbi:uncharacterized protein LOC106094425 [Stomoxys calcitrans]|uniref:uncharacterized protein LOC106094425 n=1 Tax=Stomoxys calcitrans TaxID=35570 RepID=UPI0027E25E67|nr:uncharacterized protein LOC106094425 [Stomoxys calcitrans]
MDKEVENNENNFDSISSGNASQEIASIAQDVVEENSSYSFMDLANNTFRQLSQNLECEQMKLMDLEAKRQKLQEEMLLLKREVENELEMYRANIAQSVADNLKTLSSNENKIEENSIRYNENNTKIACNVEEVIDEKPNHDAPLMNEQTDPINIKLPNILEQPFLEQNEDDAK